MALWSPARSSLVHRVGDPRVFLAAAERHTLTKMRGASISPHPGLGRTGTLALEEARTAPTVPRRLPSLLSRPVTRPCILKRKRCRPSETGVRADGWCPTPNALRKTDTRTRCCGVEGCAPCEARSMASFSYGATPQLTRSEQLCRIAKHSASCDWLCGECGHTFSMTPEAMARTIGRGHSSGCPYCAARPSIVCGAADCAPCRSRSIAGNARALALYDVALNEQDPCAIMACGRAEVVWRCLECTGSWQARPHHTTLTLTPQHPAPLIPHPHDPHLAGEGANGVRPAGHYEASPPPNCRYGVCVCDIHTFTK